MEDAGAYYGTCASSGCWTTADDHGWSASQKYFTNWGAAHDFGWPEIYSTTQPAPYADLDKAAVSKGVSVPSWSGVVWTCGSGGNEPSPDRAWSDFLSATGQATAWLTYLHNEADTC